MSQAGKGVDSGQVLRSVSEGLRKLIRSHISELASESAVVFESPADIDSQGETKLSLYLLQLEINPFLRNTPATINRVQGSLGLPNSLTVTAPPLVADLLYMMVPYARSAEQELVLVDKLVRLFHDIPALTGEASNLVLRQSGNEIIPIVPEFCSFERLHNIWSGFPNKPYKLTKLYTLSPVRIPSEDTAQVNMVKDGDWVTEQIEYDAARKAVQA